MIRSIFPLARIAWYLSLKTQPLAFRSARRAAEKRQRMKLRILGGFLSFLLPAPDVLS
jgi:hypothetical protein